MWFKNLFALFLKILILKIRRAKHLFELHQKWCLFLRRQMKKRHHFWCSSNKSLVLLIEVTASIGRQTIFIEITYSGVGYFDFVSISCWWNISKAIFNGVNTKRSAHLFWNSQITRSQKLFTFFLKRKKNKFKNFGQFMT